MKKIFLVLVVLALIVSAGALVGCKSKAKKNAKEVIVDAPAGTTANNTQNAQTAQGVGDTIILDNLEITIGNSTIQAAAKAGYNDHIVTMTIKNTSKANQKVSTESVLSAYAPNGDSLPITVSPATAQALSAGLDPGQSKTIELIVEAPTSVTNISLHFDVSFTNGKDVKINL
jgi:predicted component of type VI protein secretion system